MTSGSMSQPGIAGLFQLLLGSPTLQRQFLPQQPSLMPQETPSPNAPGGPGWKGTPPIMPVENQKTDIGSNMPLPVIGQAMDQGLQGLLPMLLGQMSPQMQGTMGLWQMLQGMRR
jgi:hypothetical protein